MGYLFLSAALLAGAVKGFCGKKVSQFIQDPKGAMMANLIRMLLCIFIGFVIILAGDNLLFLIPTPQLLLIAALSGISTALFVVLWLLAVRKSAYMLLEVFLMLGILVPLAGCYLLFQESISLSQWIGILILLAAVYLMCSYNNSIKTKITFSSLGLLIACGLSGGVTDFSQKLFVKFLPAIPVSVFNFYTYVFAALTLGILFFRPRSCSNISAAAQPVIPEKHPVSPEKQSADDLHCSSVDSISQSVKNTTLSGKLAAYILVMAVCLFLNSYFKTIAADHLDSIQLYPLNQGMALVLSTTMAAVFFHEKFKAKAIVGIAFAFLGLLLINVLKF